LNVAIVLGSANSDGNTRKLTDTIALATSATVFDLSDYQISFYDYAHQNKDDDFLPLMQQLVKFDHIVFSSPVYWYAMSAPLKVFFDRLSDCLTIDKNIGRKLQGKSCSVIATGFDAQAPDCFFEPIKLSARYLSMNYKGQLYCCCQGDEFSVPSQDLSLFLRSIA